MSLLTEDEIITAFKESDGTWISAGKLIEAKIMQKLREQNEPLCHVFNNYGQWSVVAEDAGNPSVIPVFTNPAPSAPEGWTLMPNNLTDAIYKAMLDSQGPVEVTYKAMLVAAARSE